MICYTYFAKMRHLKINLFFFLTASDHWFKIMGKKSFNFKSNDVEGVTKSARTEMLITEC